MFVYSSDNQLLFIVACSLVAAGVVMLAAAALHAQRTREASKE